MKKRKLKPLVVPVVYLVLVACIFVGLLFFGKNFSKIKNGLDLSVISLFKNNVSDVVEIANENIIKPFSSEKVIINKNYYDRNSNDESKINSIIKYEDTYMQNTGILYSSDEEFDVIASLPGKVTSVMKDELLGNVIYIEYNTNTTIAYYGVDNSNLKIGDGVNQGDIIGKSSTCNFDDSIKYNLLFEVYLNGKLTNPNEFFQMDINELNS